MATYLVTGAAGFIGSKLAFRLIDLGHTVVTIDNLSTGFLTIVPKEAILIKGGCQDQKVIDQLYKYDFEAIFHIAGQSSGEISYDNPVYDLQTNTQSTLQLLKYCLDSGCKKMIYASSMSVYGDKNNLPVREEMITSPKSFYGVGKLASEHYLRIYSELGITTTALRLFNVFGPGQNLANMRQGMVSIFLAQALKNHHINVKGSADRFRDFIYVDDVIEAFLLSNSISHGFNIFNISSQIKTTVGELVEQIIQYTGKSIPVKFEGSTPGDQFGIFGDNSRARQILNWKPKVTFEEGMRKMVEWAKYG